MNLLLLTPADFAPDGTVRLEGRRALHAREVLKAAAGDVLRVGLRGGKLGTARVLSALPDEIHLEVALEQAPPPRPRIDLLLAIPRPKALKKVLPAVASLGIDRLVLLNAARVEKSYFDSKVLDPEFLDGLLSQGLEQAKDTIAPELWVRERFRPFVEDELDAALPGSTRVLTHPTAAQPLSALSFPTDRRLTLAIGPEGGWVPFEIELLEKQGFTGATLGPRILRTEVAVPYILGNLAALRT